MIDVEELERLVVAKDQATNSHAFETLAFFMMKHRSSILEELKRGREYKKALEPFAREAAVWPDYVPDSDFLFIASPDDIEPILDEYASEHNRPTAGVSFSNNTVTVGDLRRARTALQDQTNG